MKRIVKWLNTNKWLFLILITGAILRFYKLDFQEPWLDEISTLQVTDPTLTFSETNWLIMNRDGFPHFYFLSLKFLSSIIGHNIFTLRLFSAFFGLITIFYVYKLLKELFSKEYGYVGAALLSVNSFHIYHSQEARCYTLLVFFVVFATYWLMIYLKDKTLKNIIILGVAIGLIPNAHPLGFLNVAVIGLTLFAVLLFQKDVKAKFNQLLLLFFIIVLFSLPLLPKLLVLSNIQSFWIPELSFETTQNAFFELLGNVKSNFYIYVVSLISAVIISTFYIFKSKVSKNSNLKTINYLIIFWFAINIGVIILKSYISISIILNRYFIGSLVLFILSFVYILFLIKKRWITMVFTCFIIISSLWYLILQNKYYETITKTQFSQLSNEIIKKHNNQDKIYSAYGFVTNILFKNTSCYRKMREITFDDYLNSIRINPNQIESFWYFDGNFRPFSLTTENQIFLEENFILNDKIEKKDCWARHYIPKNEISKNKNETISLTIEDFENVKIEGNMYYLFQNGTIKSKVLYLKQGTYELEIEAISYPKQPINNENAIIEVKVNEYKIWKGQLSNEEKIKPIINKIEINDNSPKVFSISYLNDIYENDKDRNLGIKNINLKRIK